MNKTITIALAGFSIIIEEEAYFTLAQYFNALRASLEADEADEVMHDIELRVYEILKEKLATEKREVVNTSDITHVISLMGTPEQINHQEESPKFKAFSGKAKRELFRNPNDRILSGVAAGIAEYMGIKAIWVRILFVIFSFTLVTIVIYITLWILMPEAQSTTDILKMKGQSLNFENIKEQSMKFARKADNEIGEAINGISPFATQAAKLLQKLFLSLFTILGYIFGTVFLIVAVSIIGGAVLGLTVASIQETTLFENLNFFVESKPLIYAGIITAIIFTLFLCTLFVFLGVKCIAPSKKIPHIGWILGILGIGSFLGSMVCVSFPIQVATKNDGFWVEKNQQIPINSALDTLKIIQLDTTFTGNYKNYWGNLQSDGNHILVKTRKYIEIDTTSAATPQLEITTGQIQNKNTSSKTTIAVKVENNKILIPNKFITHSDSKFNPPYIHLKLLVPKTKTIWVDQNVYADYDKLKQVDSIFNANKPTLK